MDMLHAKTIKGTRPLTEQELEELARDQLASLREGFAARPQLAKCHDVISQRLADELRLVSRMIDMVEGRTS